MPIETFSAAEAAHNIRRNRNSIWPDGRRENARLGIYATCAPTPSFSFSPSDDFFTMGSCFAREIEKFLVKNGFSAPMTALALPKEEMISGTPNEILNKYTPFSMLNELTWALTGATPPDEHLYLEAEDGLYLDPHLHPDLKPVTLERAKERRAAVSALTARIKDCRVIVLTMGLVEAWFDNLSGLYLNGQPPKRAIDANPNRFALHVLSYEDVITAIEGIRSVISQHCRPDARILITVSPVPFRATFTGRDALSANTYSKSVLRTAVETFVRRHNNVDYFPSYEMVTLSDRAAAYWIDNIHVRPDMVARIMNTVFSNYMPERASEFVNAQTQARSEDMSGPALFERANRELRADNASGAAQLISMAMQEYGDNGLGVTPAEAHGTLGMVYLHMKQPQLAEQSLKQSLTYDPTNDRYQMNLGIALARQNREEEALEAFRKTLQIAKDRKPIEWRLGVQHERMGQIGEAIACYRRADGFDDANARLKALEALAVQ